MSKWGKSTVGLYYSSYCYYTFLHYGGRNIRHFFTLATVEKAPGYIRRDGSNGKKEKLYENESAAGFIDICCSLLFFFTMITYTFSFHKTDSPTPFSYFPFFLFLLFPPFSIYSVCSDPRLVPLKAQKCHQVKPSMGLSFFTFAAVQSIFRFLLGFLNE